MLKIEIGNSEGLSEFEANVLRALATTHSMAATSAVALLPKIKPEERDEAVRMLVQKYFDHHFGNQAVKVVIVPDEP